MLPDDLQRRLSALAADARASASELLPQALGVIGAARAHGPVVLQETARALARVQPAMAQILSAAAIALDDPDGEKLRRFERAASRARQAVLRFGLEALAPSPLAPGPLRLVTWSASQLVRDCTIALARTLPVTVACAEGRPALEGRALAGELAQAGIAVELFTDGGASVALASASAVAVGADLVAGDWWVNKAGTGALAAAAFHLGIPVYVLSGRDKFLPPGLVPFTQLRSGPSPEVWDQPPAGVTVRNPYFERISTSVVTAFVTDIGLLTPDMLPAATAALPWRPSKRAIDLLGSG
jgi:hypothetical protein